jgi:AcrR family transcriptional regulator
MEKDLRKERGTRSREALLAVAKEEFFIHGYNGTTIKNIVKRVNMPLSSFTYYFRTKDDLVSLIYNSYMSNIYSFFDQYEWFASDTRLFQHTAVSFVFYENIFNIPGIKRFYFEVLMKNSNDRILRPFARGLYTAYVRDYALQMSSYMFDALLSYDFGGRREIFLGYYDGSLHISEEELLETVIYMMPRAMTIESQEIKRVDQKCKKFLSEIDYSRLRML